MKFKIDKPKPFDRPKQEDSQPGIAVWSQRTWTPPRFETQYFQEYNLFLGNERWEIKCSGINMRINHQNYAMEHDPLRYYAMHVEYDPLRVEFYNCNIPFEISELYQWVRDSANEINIINYGRLKKNIRLEHIGPQSNQYILYGCLLNSVSLNDYNYHYDIEPILECEICIDRFEPLV